MLPLPPPPPALSQLGRLLWAHRLPARYQDIYPKLPHPVPSTSSSNPTPTMSTPIETAVIPHVLRLIVQNQFRTSPNAFGLWKDYRYRPSQDPDTFILPEDLYHPNTSADSTIDPGPQREMEASSPYKTKSVELVMNWQNTSSSAKSNEEINWLVCDILHHPEFRLDKLVHFNAACENWKADTADEISPFLQSFTHANISIDMPLGNHSPPCSVSIPGLYFRKLTTLIQDAFQSPIS
jgi:hypothetical protein